MKLSFSTNGWNSYKWNDCFEMANAVGFDGIEIHNIKNEVFSGEDAPFNIEKINETVRRINEHDIEIPCIDSTCNIADKSKFEENIKEITNLVSIACGKDVQIKYMHLVYSCDDLLNNMDLVHSL